MDKNYKILIFGLPATGHINPLFPILKELAKINQLKLIVYLTTDYKQQFDSINVLNNVELRHFKNFNYNEFQNKVNSSEKDNPAYSMKFFLDIADANIEYLAKEISNENPNLIIYDIVSMYFKWLVSYYNKWYEIAKKSSISQKKNLKFAPEHPLPPLIGFSPAFIFNADVFPNRFEQSMLVQFSFKLIWNLIKVVFYQLKFCLKFGLKFTSLTEVVPLKLDENHKFVFASLLSDLQPRAHLFDSIRYKFVGATFEENKLEPLASQEPFESLLKKFSNSNKKLIYVSLGSILNQSFEKYSLIIDSFKLFDEKTNSELTVIVSLHETVYDLIQEKVKKNKKLEISSNIVLVKSAPQIAVLKHAFLFITHSGMNSTSESIHFGVPMICVPVGADQPLVAYRVCDELGLGIRLDYRTMKSKDIYLAVQKILNDSSYRLRTQRYAQLSKMNKGAENARDLIMDYLNSLELK
jgi:MGT family glycosyltransferase